VGAIEMKGKGSAGSSPSCGARGAVLVVWDATTDGIDGGEPSSSVRQRRRRDTARARVAAAPPRVQRGIGALGKAFIGPGNHGRRAGRGSGGGGRIPRDAGGRLGVTPDGWGPDVSDSLRLAGGAHVAVARAQGGLAQLLLGCCMAGPRPKGARARGLEEQPGRGWARSTSRPKTRREKRKK